jgi:hypothetical protein
VAVHQRAVAVDVPDAADRAGHRANLSAALLARYENTGSVPDLEEAVAAARAATDMAGPGRPVRPREAEWDPVLAIRRARQTSQSGRASALLCRYLYGRVQADLDEAIVAGRAAFAAVLAGDPDGPGLQANLANLLLERFSRMWRLDDLTEAMTAAQAAADAAPDQDPARGVTLSALGLAYANYFACTGNIEDLDRAIEVGQIAVVAARASHPGAAACRALELAVGYLGQAVEAIPAGGSERWLLATTYTPAVFPDPGQFPPSDGRSLSPAPRPRPYIPGCTSCAPVPLPVLSS